MNIVGLVQARMGSVRLPGKVLKPLAGRPLVGHIFDRLRATNGVSAVILATTQDKRNDALSEFAASEGVLVYRASMEDDIAERLNGAASLAHADAILKVNGDCPMVDPEIMGRLVRRFQEGDVDYVSNKIRWTWPEGLSAEVISSAALAWCHANLTTTSDREFVANFIRDKRQRFRIASIEGGVDLTRYKWSVDTAEDFVEVETIVNALSEKGRLFSADDIVRYVESRPASRFQIQSLSEGNAGS